MCWKFNWIRITCYSYIAVGFDCGLYLWLAHIIWKCSQKKSFLNFLSRMNLQVGVFLSFLHLFITFFPPFLYSLVFLFLYVSWFNSLLRIHQFIASYLHAHRAPSPSPSNAAPIPLRNSLTKLLGNYPSRLAGKSKIMLKTHFYWKNIRQQHILPYLSLPGSFNI
jgi:hypothetical protein